MFKHCIVHALASLAFGAMTLGTLTLAAPARAQTVDLMVPGLEKVIRAPVGVPIEAVAPKERHLAMTIGEHRLSQEDVLLGLDAALPITVGAVEFDPRLGLYLQPSEFMPQFAALSKVLSIHTVIERIDGFRLLPANGFKPMDVLNTYMYDRRIQGPGMDRYSYIEYRIWHEEPNPNGGRPLVAFEKGSDGKDLYHGMIIPLWRPDEAVQNWRKRQLAAAAAGDRKVINQVLEQVGGMMAAFGPTLQRWQQECESNNRGKINKATC